jgi:hypothetical protein
VTLDRLVTIAAISAQPSQLGFVSAGQEVRITASGIWCLGSGNCFGPDGEGTFNPTDNNTILPSEPKGTLIGRIDSGPWFRVGSGTTFVATVQGTVEVIFNDKLDAFGDNDGQLDVRIVVVSN